jgi:hypothetical protein
MGRPVLLFFSAAQSDKPTGAAGLPDAPLHRAAPFLIAPRTAWVQALT